MLEKKKILKLAVASLTVLSLVGCSSGGGSSADSVLDKIAEDKEFTVGISSDHILFALEDTATKEIKGYEVDIANRIAKDIEELKGVSGIKVKLTKVNSKTRTTLLDEGSIDAIIAAMTITEERAKSWNFSSSYFNDSVSILAKTGEFPEGVKGFKDYASKEDRKINIGVALGTTSKDALREYMKDKIGMSDSEIDDTVDFKEFNTGDEIIIALNSGTVDGYCIDYTGLMRYQQESNGALEILGETAGDLFAPQPLGIATRYKNNEDTEWTKFIQSEIKTMWEDGTIQELLEKYNCPAQEAPTDLGEEYGPYHHVK